MLQAAAAAWQRKDFQQSIDILKRARAMAPTDPQLLLQLGFCHGACYDFELAGKAFDNAVRIAIQKTNVFLTAGMLCIKFGRYDMAEPYFEQALKQDGGSAEAAVRLAEIRERQNRAAEAIHLAKRALELTPGYAPALLVRARLHRQAGEFAEAEKILFTLETMSIRSPWLVGQIRYETGIVLDRQGRFDEAMAAVLKAKASAKSTPDQKAARESVLRNFKRTAETFSPDLARRWHGRTFTPQHRLAPLCGFPRSGTTLLEQVLDAHPDIVSLEEINIFHEEALLPLGSGHPPETHFLSFLDSASPERLQQSRADYFRMVERFIGQPINGRLLVDKNPPLLAIVPAIACLFPEARFLVSLRDPRDVCLSCFLDPLLSTSTARANFETLDNTVTDYISMMGLWLAIKPHVINPFLEVRYEDLVDNLEGVARRSLEFLGVPWDGRVLEFQKQGENKLVRSPTYADVRKPVTRRSVGRWRNYQKYFEPYLEKLEPFIRAFGYE